MRGSDRAPASATALGGICLLALGLRVIVAFSMGQSVLFADMQDYFDRAQHLLETGSLWPDAFRVPLYPIFVAAILAIGENLTAVRIAQAVLGTATVALTFVVCARVTTRRGALAAALLVAIYPALVLYPAYLMSETLFACLLMLGVALWGHPHRWSAAAAGAAIGAATLTRSTGLAAVAAVVATEVFQVVRHRTDISATAQRTALFAVGFAIVLAPWVQRNYTIYGRLIPTDTSSGFNALLGNFDGATGRHPGLAAIDTLAQRYWRTARNDAERSDIGLQAARDFTREHPERAAALAVRKVTYLWGVEGREHAWGYSFHIQGRRSPTTVWAWGLALILSFPALMTLAIVGLLRPGTSLNTTTILVALTLMFVTLIHVLSFGDSRFHLPWVPLLAIAAARGFAPREANPWTASRQTLLAVVLVAFALVWIEQARELLDVLPRLAASPIPLQLPYLSKLAGPRVNFARSRCGTRQRATPSVRRGARPDRGGVCPTGLHGGCRGSRW